MIKKEVIVINIILYSTGCPKCNVLKEKLTNKNIKYSEVNSKDEMIALGIDEIPVLSVDGNMMNFKESVDWVNNYKES